MGKSKAKRYAEALKQAEAMAPKAFLLTSINNAGSFDFGPCENGNMLVGFKEFTAKEALELAAWINDVFGDESDE